MQENPIVGKLRDLYVLKDKVYIYQPRYIWNGQRYERNTDGRYFKENLHEKKLTKQEFVKKSITTSLKRHILKDSKHTLGVFGGQFLSKFICFDIDYKDLKTSKFIAKKIGALLKEELGIKEYYISYSGNKGYHLEIFFDDLIENSLARKLYIYVINSIGVADADFKVMFGGQVELRGVTYEQGVKMPLGIHQKTLKYCCYCTNRGIRHMTKEESEEYILTFKKISHKVIEDFFNKNKKSDDIEQQEPELEQNISVNQYIVGENILSKLQKLDIYDSSFEKMETNIINYIENGLKYLNTRHDVTFIIALYYKHLGYTREVMETCLIAWLQCQKGKYTTKYEDALKDTLQIIKDVSEKDYNLRTKTDEDVEITFKEFQAILTQVSQKNEKLVLFAILSHSKHFTNKIDDVFYMTYEQMKDVTNLDLKTVKRIVPRLVEQGVLEFIERNRTKKGTYYKLPNRYRIILKMDNEVGNTANITYISDIYNQKNKDFINCLQCYYTKQEAKKILPRKQYEAFFAS